MVDDAMRGTVLKRLSDLALAEDLRVLYACESGSRAWGFADPGSDYDVRFLYLRPLSYYLAVFPKTDHLQLAKQGDLDVAGWDLKKALGLMYNGNPVLNEWLGSPVVYWEEPGFMAGMRALAARFYRPSPSAYHYYHMARDNYEKYLTVLGVPLKKYLYVLRPVLAVLWVEANQGPVPTAFGDLLAGLDVPEAVRAESLALVARKMSGEPLGVGPRNAVLDAFLAGHLKRWGEGKFAYAPQAGDDAELDTFFQTTLWGATA